MNAVTLSGYIHSDKIELRKTSSGTAVTSFIMKVRRDHRQSAEKSGVQYDFLTIVCWGEKAEYASLHYKYGMLIEVQGSIRTGSRKPKGYKILNEDNDKVLDFYLPVFEIYARRILILSKEPNVI